MGCKKYDFHKLKDYNEQLKNDTYNIDNILINGKKQSNFLTPQKFNSDKQRKSFSGPPLPDNFDEISNKLDIKSADKKLSSHVNPVVFIDKFKTNLNDFVINSDKEMKKEKEKEKEGFRNNYHRKSFMR